VHQRASGIRVFAPRHRAVSIARQKAEYGERMVWLVAMDRVSRSVFNMGDLRDQVRAGLLWGRRHEGISRPVQRNCASPATGPLLSPSPAAEIRALERADPGSRCAVLPSNALGNS